MAYSSTLYRSPYHAEQDLGYATPVKSTSAYASNYSSGGTRYYDALQNDSSNTPLSARGYRNTGGEGYYGVTPTPGLRPASQGGSSMRRAMTPTTGSTRTWETPNSSYISSANAPKFSTGASTPPKGSGLSYTRGGEYLGSPTSVRKNLTPELSLAQERYSSRNNLSSMHPNYTASSAQRAPPVQQQQRTSVGYAAQAQQPQYQQRESSLTDSFQQQQREGRSTAWQSPYQQQQAFSASPGRRRAPSMVKTGYHFLPPPDAADRQKPLVVLDLDETLVYARNGPINVRPGVKELLQILHGRAEVAVWTAGERDYAQSVIQKVDTNHTIKHCVYRHPKWWTGQPGYSKDLAGLGRNIDRVILVDNTPDCLKSQPWNGLLVEDFTGRSDNELSGVAATMEFIIESDPNETIPDILSQCPHVIRRRIPLDGYGEADLWTLADSTGDYSPGRNSRVNRDLPQQRASSGSRATSLGSSSHWKRY